MRLKGRAPMKRRHHQQYQLTGTVVVPKAVAVERVANSAMQAEQAKLPRAALLV
jgi:hypothetical protein